MGKGKVVDARLEIIQRSLRVTVSIQTDDGSLSQAALPQREIYNRA